MEKIINTD